MDPLTALLRRRARRRIAIGIGVAIGLAIAASRGWNALRAPAPLPPDTDARIQSALAREAERALREGPRGAPPALHGAGLRALGEHWSPRAVAAPAAPWTPAPLTPGALVRPRDPAPLPRSGLPPAQRALVAPNGDPGVALRSGALAPPAAE